MLSDEQRRKVLEPFQGIAEDDLDWDEVARAVEREATAPLIEQIKEDEALMRDVFNAYENGVGMIAAINTIRQRLESKK